MGCAPSSRPGHSTLLPRGQGPSMPGTDEAVAPSAEIDFRGVTPPLPSVSPSFEGILPDEEGEEDPPLGFCLNTAEGTPECDLEEGPKGKEDLPLSLSTQIYFTAPSPSSALREAATPIPVQLSGPSHHSIPSSIDTWSNSEAQLKVPSRSHQFEEPMKDAFDSTLTGDVTLMSRHESRNPFADFLHRSTPSYSGDIAVATIGDLSIDRRESPTTRSVDLSGLASAPFHNVASHSPRSDVVGASVGDSPSLPKPITPAGFSAPEPDDPRWWEPLVQRQQVHLGIQIPPDAGSYGNS
jgi:hypothetical protein